MGTPASIRARVEPQMEPWEVEPLEDSFTYKFQKKIVKAWLLEGHRVDGRAKNEIRPLASEVSAWG